MDNTNSNELQFNAMVNNVKSLSRAKTCLSCGGDMFIQTGVCPYCGKHIANIEYASKYLSEILLNIKNKILELDELTIALYAIKETLSYLSMYNNSFISNLIWTPLCSFVHNNQNTNRKNSNI